MVKEKNHEHNLKALYYRKKVSESENQNFVKLKGFKICDICFKIVREEIKEIGKA